MKQTAKRFRLVDFLSDSETFHIARVNITSSRDLNYHTHDYAEILWVESGNGIHNINERKLPLKAGDVVMIRPQDRHSFSAKGKGLTIINLAFSSETLDFLRQRYPEETGRFFNPSASLPYSTVLPHGKISRLSSLAENAFPLEKSRLLEDSLIITLFRILYDIVRKEEDTSLPAWLKKALTEFSTGSRFAGGAEEFAALCGRNQDYITRTLKRHTGLTLIQTIQKIRMRYATTQLTITTMPIKEIARNCGYANLGHFYKVFADHLGCSPKHYRTSTQQLV